jgi:hypothetical protein
MFEPIGDAAGKVLAFKLTGEIGKEETEKLSRILAEAIRREGPIRLFLILEHYPSMNSAESLYEDLRFAKLHSDHIERMAVIGDRSWKTTWVSLFGLFGGIDSRYFDTSEMKAAWEWVGAKE